MSEFWSLAGWPIVFCGAAYLIYAIVVRPKMASADAALGKAETVASTSGFTKIWSRLAGWKTTILAFVAGLAQLPSLMMQYVDADVIKEWQLLPWASVVDAKTANFITLACAFLIPIVHSMGYAKAANTVPKTEA